MASMPIDAAILFWTKETPHAMAAPGDAQRLNTGNLHQRVVRIAGRKNGWTEIYFGPDEYIVSDECLRPIGILPYEVGDMVTIESGDHRIRDIIWHFRTNQPNFYLERGGRRLSQRYTLNELS